MATTWFLKSFDDEFGPISFNEMVDLVRDGTVTEDDFVRPAASSDYQRARSIIGLFYMARRARDASNAAPAADVSIPAGSVEPDSPAVLTSPPVADSRPDWLVRLLEARDSQLSALEQSAASGLSNSQILPDERSNLDKEPQEAATGISVEETNTEFENGNESTFHEDDRSIDSTVTSTGGDWSRAVDDALKATDHRHSKGNVQSQWQGLASFIGRGTHFCSRIVEGFGGGTRLMGLVYRVLAGIICANLTAYWIMSWSSHEALRFPSRTSATVYLFPLIGPCTDQEYLFWLFDAAIGAGFLAYWAASVLVAKTEN